MSDVDQVWSIRVAGREVQVRDLPVGVLADISKRTDQSWILSQAAPLLNLQVAEELLRAGCQHLDVEVPEPLTARTITDYFVQVDDDLPEQFEDGIPQ